MAKHPVSTLSSTIRKSHHHHHHHKYHLTRPQLSPDSVEDLTVANSDSPSVADNQHICGEGRRHKLGQYRVNHRNVAIATQVISPSAIGGSLKISGRRKLCSRYDPEGDTDDDDQGLFPRRKRIPWGKLTCYGVSIGIILLLMTGVILAVGYMQSEKQRILAQSQKLSQEFRSQTNVTATTWRPKIVWETVTSSPVVENTTMMEELTTTSNESKEIDFDEGRDDDDDDDDDEEDEDDDSKELEIYDPEEQSSRKSENARVDETGPLLFTVLTRPLLHTKEEYNENSAEHRSPSEVKVLPPKDFFTKGLSIEIPIYNDTESNKKDHNRSLSFEDIINPASIPFQILPSIGFPLNLNLTHAAAIPELNFSLPDPSGSAEVNLILPSKNYYSEEDVGKKSQEEDSFHKLQPEDPLKSFPSKDASSKLFSTKDSSTNSLPAVISSEELFSKDSPPKLFSAKKSSPNVFSADDSSSKFISLDDPPPKLISLEDSSQKQISLEEPSPKLVSLDNSSPQLIPLEETSPKVFTAGNEDEETSSENSNPVASFQTDLFHDYDFDQSSSDDVSEDGTDSTMSASTKTRGSKTPSSIRPSDNMYTPRPGTSPYYPARPRFPSKAAVDFPMREFSSNQSEVRVPPPETTPKPDFGALTTTPESSSNKVTFNFNFQPDHASKDQNFKPSKSDSKNADSFQYNYQPEATTPAPLSTTEYQIISPNTAPVTQIPNHYSGTTEFHFDFHQLTTPTPLGGNTGPTYDFQTNNVPDVLSKRTYNFDFNPQASASTNSNPFAHLLNSGVTSNIGSATSTGANLGYQNSYNFDTSYNSYSPPSNLNIPSGTIPLDLASSYIQAGSSYQPQQYRSPAQQTHAQQLSTLQDFGFHYNPAPQLDVASVVRNSANSATNQFPTIITTPGNPNPPEYNTITQGIHLLSLLHGNIPSQYTDHQPSASNSFETSVLAKPEYQIAGLTGYGGSSTAFLNNLGNNNNPSYSPAQGRSLQTQNDYQPQSDSQTSSSFSQNIVTKLADFSNNFKKSQADSDTSSSGMHSQITAPNPDSFRAKLTSPSEEQRDLSHILKIPSNVAATEGTGGGKAMDMEVSSSNIHPVVPKYPRIGVNGAVPTEKTVIVFSNRLLSKSRRTKDDSRERKQKGLKSGFYI